jgi:ATP-dependent Clp protease protease subunit
MSEKQQAAGQGFNLVENSSGAKELFIDGEISSWTSNNAAAFRKAFKELEALSDTVTIRIGVSPGGSVFDGFVLTSLIKESKAKVITICEGLAASMAAVIFVSGDERQMAKDAMILTHLPKGGISGEADKIREYAEMLSKIEKGFIELFADQTGNTEDEVKKWFKTGVDIWHDSAEALERGIATKLIDEGYGVDTSAIQDLLKDPNQLASTYAVAQQKQTTQNNSNIKMKELLAKLCLILALAPDSTEEQVLAKVKELGNEKASLDAELKKFKDAAEASQKQEAEQLVAKLIEDGKMPEGMKPIIEKQFSEDFESTKTLVEGMLEKPEGSQGGDDPKHQTLAPEVKSFLDGLGVAAPGASGSAFNKPVKDMTDKELEKALNENPDAVMAEINGTK